MSTAWRATGGFGLLGGPEFHLQVVHIGDRIIKLSIFLSGGCLGREAQALPGGFVAFVIGERVGVDDFGEALAEEFAHACQAARDGGFGDSHGFGDFLAWAIFQHAEAEDGKVQKLGLALDQGDGVFDFGAEDSGFVSVVHGEVGAGTHPGVVQGGGAGRVAAAFLGHAAVHFVAQDMLGDGQQPGGKACPAGGIEAVDGFRECREGFLGEVLDGVGTDATTPPLGKLGADDGSEGLPQFEPGGLVVGPQPFDECGGDLVHGVGGVSVTGNWGW